MASRYPETSEHIVDQINHFFDRVVACVDLRRRRLIARANEKRLEMVAREEKAVKSNDLVFQGECEQLEQLILNVGDVLEEEVAVIPRYQEMRKVVEVGKGGKNPGQLSKPRGIAIDKNSKHIFVAECDPARVSVFSESGEFLNTFTPEHLKNPFGITIHRNYIYITDTGVHGVFRLKIQTDISMDASLSGHGCENGKFDCPQQLTVSINRCVFVADFGNHRIQILDESLRYQRTIEHRSMQYPCDVKLTNEKVFVLAKCTPCLHEFSNSGEIVRSFLTWGLGGQVMEAVFLCLDAQNNIIISDWWANSVKIFSPKGTLLHSIEGFAKGELDLQGIALTKQLKLVVISPDVLCQLHIYS